MSQGPAQKAPPRNARDPLRRRARWCFRSLPILGLALALAPACGGSGGDSGPTAPACASISGAWQSQSADSCGAMQQAMITVAQTGCNFSFTIPGAGTFGGTLQANNEAALQVTLDAACGGSTIGRLEVTNGRIEVFYGDGADCCRHGGATLTR